MLALVAFVQVRLKEQFNSKLFMKINGYQKVSVFSLFIDFNF